MSEVQCQGYAGIRWTCAWRLIFLCSFSPLRPLKQNGHHWRPFPPTFRYYSILFMCTLSRELKWRMAFDTLRATKWLFISQSHLYQKSELVRPVFYPCSPKIDGAVSVSKYLNRFNSQTVCRHFHFQRSLAPWYRLASLRRNNRNAPLGEALLYKHNRKLWLSYTITTLCVPGIRAYFNFETSPT